MSTQTQNTENTIRENSRSQFVLRIPKTHTMNIGVDEGEQVSLRVFNFEGNPTFEVTGENEFAITRKLREPYTKDEGVYHITLPKPVVEMLGLADNDVSISSDSSKILAAVDNSPHIDAPVNVHQLSEDELYRRGNVYVGSFPNDIDYPFQLSEDGWVWADTLEDTFVIGVSFDESRARETAHELTVSKTSDSYEVVIPKTFVDALGLDDIVLSWGYDESGILTLVGENPEENS